MKYIARRIAVVSKTHDLSSQVDGIVSTFTLSPSAVTDSLVVTLDGVTMNPGEGNDYKIVSSSSIEFLRPIVIGSTLLAMYIEK